MTAPGNGPARDLEVEGAPSPLAEDGRESIRLLFVNDHLGYQEGVTHGVTSYFLTVLPRLSSVGVEMVGCFLRGPHTASEQLESQGVQPIFLDRAKWDPRALSDLIRLIRRHHIQIVHLAGMKAILLGRIAALLTGTRAIIHFHDTRKPGPVVGPAQRLLAPVGSLAIGVSSAVRETAVEDFRLDPGRVRVLHNPIEYQRFAGHDPGARTTVREELAVPAEAPVIGILGRLTEDKGHPDLIRAMPAILEHRPDAHLLIAGEGTTRRRLIELVARSGLESRVRFVGHRTDVPRLLAAIDALALPSVREGLPYSVLEAMAAGRPVVAFRVGGVPDLISHLETGILVEPGDVSDLARWILRVLDDPALAKRLGSNARRRAKDFSISAHLEALRAAYEEVLDQEPPAFLGRRPQALQPPSGSGTVCTR